VRAAVVEPRDRLEAFLACGVPDLQTDCGVAVWVVDALGEEGGADGRLDGDRGGGVEEAGYEACFADALGA